MRHVAAITGVGVVLGCGGASEAQLRTRAAFDMKCEESRIEIVQLDPRTRGVRGCGQQATYVESCARPNDTAGQDCTWILNTDSTSAPAPRASSQ